MANTHVLAIGIIGYAGGWLAAPPEMLRQLQQLLQASTEFQRARQSEQLFYQLTGDGVTLVFSGDPEAPVRCAFEIGRMLAGLAQPLNVSMGIHSVPVAQPADSARVNDEAMNIAQQIMSRGETGHILLSADAVSGLSQLGNWTRYLSDLGYADLAPGVRLRLFNLHTDEIGNQSPPKKLSAAAVAAGASEESEVTVVSTSPAAEPTTDLEETISPRLEVRQVFKDSLLVHSILGAGAMGSAYLASHSVLQMPLVIKTFKRNTGASIFREAHLAARVTSPHVVGVLDAGYDKKTGIAFLVQRYVDGIDLHEVIKSLEQCQMQLPVNMVCRMVIDAARGLHAIHQAGIIHRDVKPANLFLTGDGTTTVGDFGVALDTAAAIKEQEVAGSPLYMAPEQWLSPHELTWRTDIYALGATAHHLATGTPPFNAATLDEIREMHLEHEYVPPASKDPSAAYLFSVIARTLNKAPDERFQTAEALARILQIVFEPQHQPQFVLINQDEARVGRHLQVELQRGDIVETECDVVVNAANTQLMMNVGVAQALRRAAGQEVETQAKAEAPKAMGEVVWTTAGNLRARWMAHAVAAMKGATCLQRCVLRVLFGAEARGAETVVFPALGTGVAEVPMPLAAKLMLEAIRTFAGFHPPRLRTIRIVLYDDSALHCWRSIMRSM